MRLVSGVALATFVVLLPAIGPYRVPVGIAVGLGVTAANLAMLVAIRRGRSVGGAIAATDLTAILAVMAVAPATYAPGTILLVALAAFFLFWFRGRTAALLLVPLGVALGAIGWWRQPELWFPIWLSWAATSTLSAVAIGRMSEVAAEVGRRYDDLVNGIDAVLWEANGPIGDAAYVSERVEALLGYSPPEMASFSFLASRVHPEDLDELIASRRRIAGGDDVELGYRVRDAGGRLRHVHERVRVILDDAGRVLRRRGVLVDDTDRFEAQRWVRSYVDFIEGIPVALTILRLDDLDDPRSLKVVVGNPAAADLAGTTVADATGTGVAELFPEADAMLERLADVVRLATPLEHPFMHIHGRDEVFAMRAVPLPDQCVGVSLEDVTKRARLAESHAPPGHARPPDRAAEPGPVQRADRTRTGRRRIGIGATGGRGHGPGPLQGGQRLPRPRVRRPAAHGTRPAVRPGAARLRHDRQTRRRRVRRAGDRPGGRLGGPDRRPTTGRAV